MGDHELIGIEKIPSNYEVIEKRTENYLEKIKMALTESSSELADVSKTMGLIQSQGGWNSFWNKGNNIKTISEHINKITTVHQKTLDLIVLLMGGLGQVKGDYNFIIETIEELSKDHDGDIEVLNYLIKMKNAINDLKDRDEIIDKLGMGIRTMDDTVESLRNKIAIDSERISEIITELQVSKSLINTNSQNLSRLYDLHEVFKVDYNSITEEINNSKEHIDTIEGNFRSLNHKVAEESGKLNKTITELQVSNNNIKKNSQIVNQLYSQYQSLKTYNERAATETENNKENIQKCIDLIKKTIDKIDNLEYDITILKKEKDNVFHEIEKIRQINSNLTKENQELDQKISMTKRMTYLIGGFALINILGSISYILINL